MNQFYNFGIGLSCYRGIWEEGVKKTVAVRSLINGKTIAKIDSWSDRGLNLENGCQNLRIGREK